MHRRLDDFLAQGLAGRTHGQELLALVMAIADAARAVSANSAKGWLVGQAGGPNIGPVRRYITECKLGAADIRGRDFQLRWSASLVADLHRGCRR